MMEIGFLTPVLESRMPFPAGEAVNIVGSYSWLWPVIGRAQYWKACYYSWGERRLSVASQG